MKYQSYGWRASVPVAAPGWIYQSRKFDSRDEAHARAVLALTERYGESMYNYLTNINDITITVEEIEA